MRKPHLSPRARWYLRYYWVLPLAGANMAFIIAFRDWSTILTGVLLIAFPLLGERWARRTYQQGRTQGVLDSFNAITQGETPEEIVRLIITTNEPWQAAPLVTSDD